MRQRHTGTCHVHSVGTENDSRNTHNNGNDRQHFHDDIHIIGNDRCKSIHGSVQDSTVYISHFDRLLVFSNDILQKICVLRILLDAVYLQKLLQHNLIGPEGCDKIGQGFLQLQKFDQLLISCGKMQFFFHLLTLLVDDTQITQVHTCISVKDLKDKTCLHIGKKAADPSLHKSGQNRRVLQTDGNDHGTGNNDTKRNGSIPVLIITFLDHRNIYQDQCIIILNFDT